ncbi:hypothetical protein FK216_12630 [Moraxellaceae bacterium AER2_44_116]|nr:hypothetical protein FK216_12630 [Moraxellaceae bacterium AER2_44_116]
MRTRFYKVTITDGHLTKCVVIPAKNLKTAKLDCQKNNMKVVSTEFFGWYLVDILMGSEGLYFRAHMSDDQIFISDKSRGFSYLHDSLSKVKQ